MNLLSIPDYVKLALDIADLHLLSSVMFVQKKTNVHTHTHANLKCEVLLQFSTGV